MIPLNIWFLCGFRAAIETIEDGCVKRIAEKPTLYYMNFIRQ